MEGARARGLCASRRRATKADKTGQKWDKTRQTPDESGTRRDQIRTKPDRVSARRNECYSTLDVSFAAILPTL
jgi:hypothetical protein